MLAADQCIRASYWRNCRTGMQPARAVYLTAEACGVTLTRVKQAIGWY